MVEAAKKFPDQWFVLHQKTSEIQHIEPDILAQERAEMSTCMYSQEYECSFERGQLGSYFGDLIEKMRQEGRICHVPYDSLYEVNTVWDLGVSDATTIIWYYDTGTTIRMIDSYTGNNLGLDHYIKIVQEKNYRYGRHYAPHDIKQRELSNAMSRYEKAKQMGINFVILEQLSVLDGIDNVMMNFSKFYIDSEKCRSVINALENYRRDWDEKSQTYAPRPVARNWANHFADCVRYLCQSLGRNKKGLSSEDYKRLKAEALYGGSQTLPRFFDSKYDRLR